MNNIINFYQEKLKNKRLLLVLLAWFLISSIFSTMPLIFNKVYLKEGDVATGNIVSPRDIKFETKANKLETKQLKEARANAVANIYDVDINLIYNARSRISRFFSQIRELKSENISTNRYEQIISQELEFELSEDVLKKFLRQSTSVLVLMENLSFNIVDNLMTAGIVDHKSEEVKEKVSKVLPPSHYKAILNTIILQALENNVTFNEEKTNQAKLDATKEVKPVYTQFRKGQPILYKNDVVTAEAISIMKQLGIYGSSIDWTHTVSLVFINLFLLILFVLVLAAHGFENLYLIISLEMIMLFLSRLSISFSVLWIPIIFISMMLSLFMTNLNISITAIFRMSILVTLMIENEMSFMLFFLFTALVTSYLSRKIQNRNDITRYSFLCGLASVLIYLIIKLNFASLSLIDTPRAIVYILINSWISAIMVHGFSPYFEYVFKLLTPIKLLELADPAHPLISRLMLEAPGTYHHSLMVANLAEKAVEKLKGNRLIARVGAYYHDIGKLARPYFFIENQSGINPHDKIGSQLSAKIILSHPADGEKIARQYKLPEQIIDIISQHHGTSVISYFYRKQLQKEREAEVNIEDFHYPGPLPKSLEATIVMLADSCEAAFRSIEKPTPTKMESVIDKIIKDKLDSGQLNNSNLTFMQLSIIKETFIQNLGGMFHSRIKYEDEEDDNSNK